MAKAPAKKAGAAPLPETNNDGGGSTSSATAPEGNEADAEPDPATAAEPVPEAPGDDAESVFDRRLNRLTAIVEQAEFESGTALGDLTELVVELFKHRPKLWAAMDTNEQRDVIRHIEATCKKALAKVVLVVAQEESLTVEGTLLGKFTIDGEKVETRVKFDHADKDVVLDLYKMAGHRVVVISADDKRFSAKRREPETPGNQSPLPFADGGAPKPKAGEAITSEPPKHPADDSDLADVGDENRTHGDSSAINDGGDGEGTVALAAPEPGPDDLFGVFDEDRGEWLIDADGGDDGWTTKVDDAGRFPHGQATDLARGFGDPPLAVRQLDAKPSAEG